ncbi:MAG: MFS transporter, partial [Thermoproteota archaeon]
MIPLAKDVAKTTTSLVLMLPILSFGLMKGVGDLIVGYSTKFFKWRKMLITGILVYFLGTLVLFRSMSLAELFMAGLLMGFGEGFVYSAFYTFLTRGRRREASGMLIGMLEGSTYTGYGIGAITSGYVSIAYGLRNALLVT